MDTVTWLERVRTAHEDLLHIRRPGFLVSKGACEAAREPFDRSRKAIVSRVRKTLRDAHRVCYGPGPCIADALGPTHADVIWLRYARGMKWGSVAKRAYVSERTAHRYEVQAIDYLEARRAGNGS